MARPSCWGGTGSCGNLTNIGREGVVAGAWLGRREGVAEGAWLERSEGVAEGAGTEGVA